MSKKLTFFECETCGELFLSAEDCTEHERSCGDPGEVLFVRANGNPQVLFGPNREVVVKGEIEDLDAVRGLLVVALRQVDTLKTRRVLDKSRRANGKQAIPGKLVTQLLSQEAPHA